MSSSPITVTLQDAINAATTAASSAGAYAADAEADANAAEASAAAAAASASTAGGIATTVASELSEVQSLVAAAQQSQLLIAGLQAVVSSIVANEIQPNVTLINSQVVSATNQATIAATEAGDASASATAAATSATAATTEAGVATTQAGIATTEAGAAASSASAAAASAASISSGPVTSVEGLTGVVTGVMLSANNLSDVASPSAALSHLGGAAVSSLGTASVKNTGTSVADPGTGGLETLLQNQTVTGASKTFATADFFKRTRRSNSGSAMTDTFPASSATGMTNGTRIVVTNVDASASITITAGAGTTMPGGGSTDTIGPSREVDYCYDSTATAWRASANTRLALLNSNNLSEVASPSTALANLGGAPLASPALTGAPTAPTAAADTSTTQLATTAMVIGQAASANPVMDGSVAVGASTRFARADHVHPSDTSRVALAGGSMTGALNWAAAVSVASATTTDLGAQTGSNLVNITGTTTITSFGSTGAAGCWKWVKFAGSLTLTYNATSLILPTGLNIETSVGDTALFVSSGSGNWTCYAYQTASGLALASSAGGLGFAGGLTSVTTINDTTTLTTGGITLSSQILEAGSMWRIRAFGTFTQANSGTTRAPQVAVVWGGTQLTLIGALNATPSQAATTVFEVEFNVVGTGTSSAWVTGKIWENLSTTTAGYHFNAITPTSNTGLPTGAQTIDLQFFMSVAVAGDSWSVQSVTIERLK